LVFLTGAGKGVGVKSCAWQRTRHYRSLPILWVLLTVFTGSVLLTYPPQYPRYVLTTPALVLILAVGVVGSLRLLFPRQRRALHWQAAMVTAAALALADLFYYMLVYLPAPSYAHDPYTLLGDGVGRHLAVLQAESPGMQVYYLVEPGTRLEGTSLIDYLAPGVDDHHLDKVPDGLSGDLLFVMDAAHLDQLAGLESPYPGGQVVRLWDRRGELVFASYRVRVPVP